MHTASGVRLPVRLPVRETSVLVIRLCRPLSVQGVYARHRRDLLAARGKDSLASVTKAGGKAVRDASTPRPLASGCGCELEPRPLDLAASRRALQTSYSQTYTWLYGNLSASTGTLYTTIYSSLYSSVYSDLYTAVYAKLASALGITTPSSLPTFCSDTCWWINTESIPPTVLPYFTLIQTNTTICLSCSQSCNTLCNCTTPSPTPAPTPLPTPKPVIANVTSSPTRVPTSTPGPSKTPTTRPTPSPTPYTPRTSWLDVYNATPFQSQLLVKISFDIHLIDPGYNKSIYAFWGRGRRRLEEGETLNVGGDQFDPLPLGEPIWNDNFHEEGEDVPGLDDDGDRRESWEPDVVVDPDIIYYSSSSSSSAGRRDYMRRELSALDEGEGLPLDGEGGGMTTTGGYPDEEDEEYEEEEEEEEEYVGEEDWADLRASDSGGDDRQGGISSWFSPRSSGQTRRSLQTTTSDPTASPTAGPTQTPTTSPTGPTQSPSIRPTRTPTRRPTQRPTKRPTPSPTLGPTGPTQSPTATPTGRPTEWPTMAPTESPTTMPPTKAPTQKPSVYDATHRIYAYCLAVPRQGGSYSGVKKLTYNTLFTYGDQAMISEVQWIRNLMLSGKDGTGYVWLNVTTYYDPTKDAIYKGLSSLSPAQNQLYAVACYFDWPLGYNKFNPTGSNLIFNASGFVTLDNTEPKLSKIVATGSQDGLSVRVRGRVDEAATIYCYATSVNVSTAFPIYSNLYTTGASVTVRKSGAWNLTMYSANMNSSAFTFGTYSNPSFSSFNVSATHGYPTRDAKASIYMYIAQRLMVHCEWGIT
jgi:hypothetical protein